MTKLFKFYETSICDKNQKVGDSKGEDNVALEDPCT